MTGNENRSTPILEERLRLGSGFAAEDRDHVLATLSALDRHLAHWRPEQVDLEILVKDRRGAEQKVTLEIWLPGWPSLVARSADTDLERALIEVRKDMIRQVDDEKGKRGQHSARSHDRQRSA